VPDVTRSRRTSFPGGIASYEEGRRCVVVGCETLLSRYNSLATCAQHGPKPT